MERLGKLALIVAFTCLLVGIVILFNFPNCPECEVTPLPDISFTNEEFIQIYGESNELYTSESIVVGTLQDITITVDNTHFIDENNNTITTNLTTLHIGSSEVIMKYRFININPDSISPFLGAKVRIYFGMVETQEYNIYSALLTEIQLPYDYWSVK